ncbi:MAG: aa3-type cytochrome oxidase subunit CtaJ [Jatrophihabitans sp.]
MSVIETVLVFAGIPAGVFALAAILVLGPGAMRSPRYRPGGSWDYNPVWYLPHPEHSGPVSSLQAAGTGDAGHRLALPGSIAEPVKASGGASGEW